MNPLAEHQSLLSRRCFFGRMTGGVGAAALGSLLGRDAAARNSATLPGRSGFPQFAPKAKRVIFLFQHGGPSQMETFDYKPYLETVHGKEIPKSVIGDQRLTGMTAGQVAFPVMASPWKFSQHGQNGSWVSELMPHTAGVIDDLCVIKSMTTPQIDHDAAATFMQTCMQFPGRPSAGAWVAYGLGGESENLPAFVVMVSNGKPSSIPIYDRMWGSSFLPSKFQGVRFGGVNESVLYLNNPKGMSRAARKRTLDEITKLNELNYQEYRDPEILTRIAQYEMAFRMQTSVPELVDISKEGQGTFDLYGENAREPGTYAYNCLLARRLVERGTRFVQLFHRGWDAHFDIPTDMPRQSGQTDQATAALISDLKARGLLDDTLIIWGGEFGRSVFSQGSNPSHAKFGRDHHGRCFTMWMAGGGVKAGSFGESDEWSFNVKSNPVSVYDLYATMFHQLGIDHETLTHRFQGRDYRMTDLYGRVVKEILA
ncbi:MAG: sulfatase [Verrucomicrobiales bacterium]|nr:sulfatase [Verrucomicrobiales bacterium]|tara:strand:- start:4032 stop:5480 length:1449 start_codon:yes stop_codon:yes gene_type:complete